LIFHPVFDGVLINTPAWLLGKTSRMASPSSMAAGSGTNPPTTPGDSTNTSNVQDLEEEVVHLREKQAKME